MGLNDWLGTFAKAEGLDLSSDLEQAYEAALMIQGLELEYFNDRPVRTDVNLGLPQATQTQIFRRFRSALEICRALLSSIERQRAQLDSQELRQLQLIESVVRRYRSKEGQTLFQRPDPLPRSLLGVCLTGFAINWTQKLKPMWWLVSGAGVIPPWCRCGSCC